MKLHKFDRHRGVTNKRFHVVKELVYKLGAQEQYNICTVGTIMVLATCATEDLADTVCAALEFKADDEERNKYAGG